MVVLVKQKKINYAFGFWLIAIMLLFITPVYAQDSVPIPDAQKVISNIIEAVPNVMRLITALAYVMGMGFIFMGLLSLKHAGESRTMMSQERGLAGPFIKIAVGAALLYLPTSVQVGMSTFWVNPNPYGYLDDTSEWGEFFKNCFMIVQLIGVIAFIRGLVMLSKGGHGGQGGGIGKALTHIIGGILCINIYEFKQVIMVTIGIDS